MSSRGSGLFRSHGQSHELDFELNLAPIIDCLTVLITFTLISASFLSVSIFNAGFAASDVSTKTEVPPVSVEVELQRGGLIEIKVTGNQQKTIKVAATPENGNDIAKLKTEMEGLKTAFPMLTGITLLGDETIQYKQIVKAMETTRGVFPAVVLGGF